MKDSQAGAATEFDSLIFVHRIMADTGVTDRAIRKWIAKGTFPEPDGNLNGRNFWLRDTYRQWQTDVLAGKYTQKRSFGAPSPDVI